MNELKALEKIITAGYSITSNFSEVARFFANRRDVKVKDVVSFFKNVHCQKHEINSYRMDLKFFKGTIAGQSAVLFNKWVKERYLDNWTLKVSPQGVKELKTIKKIAEEKRDALKLKKELAIQERIDAAVNAALSTNVVKEIASIEIENKEMEEWEKTEAKIRKWEEKEAKTMGITYDEYRLQRAVKAVEEENNKLYPVKKTVVVRKKEKLESPMAIALKKAI